MMDTYTMILWTKANESDTETQTKQVFEILNILNKIDYLKPIYQTVSRKKDAFEFNLSYENVKNLINKKRDKQFPDLGSRISFFTNLNDSDSAGISISIGVSNPRFINSIVIDFNWDYKVTKERNYSDLASIFKELIIIFKPFYACIASKSNSDAYDGYYNNENDVPNSIFDLNYLGKDVIKKLKINEKELTKVYEYEKIDEGYYIRLQEEPVDTTNEVHIKLQKEINYLFGI